MFSRDEVELIAREAAAEGARLVLRDLGIPSDEAGLMNFRRDMTEARDLLEAFRVAKHTIWVTAVKWATGLLLAAVVAGIGWNVYGSHR